MRKSGVLLHISSLDSDFGIGTLGKSAYDFIDFLKESGQSFWQVLPLGPTGYLDSPYQSFSAFAGNPYFIDFDILNDWGYLNKEDYNAINWCEKEDRVDYGKIYNNKSLVLRKAFNVFKEKTDDEFYLFCNNEAYWLDDYCIFMALKNKTGLAWYDWDYEIKTRNFDALNRVKEELKDEILFFKMQQFFFYKQWHNIKDYANKNKIEIIGDLPIYVAYDSADVWANKDEFLLDENLNPLMLAACPPDDFTQDGQLWGNPVYDWQHMQENGFSWWLKRIIKNKSYFDVIRLDHFRGFEKYYSVAFNSKNARNGVWKNGPGIAIFVKIKEKVPSVKMIAEDLGFITDDVKKLLKDTGFEGMKVLQFGFDANDDSDYLPHNYNKNSILYIGTHDNPTIKQYISELNEKDFKFLKDYLRLNENEGYVMGILKSAFASVCNTVIVQMQDLLELGASSRMNTPSKSEGNWCWRLYKGQINENVKERLLNLTELYRRLH